MRIRDLPITRVSIQLNYAARERLEDIEKIKPIYKDNVLAFIFQEDCGTILTSTNYFCYKDLTISKIIQGAVPVSFKKFTIRSYNYYEDNAVLGQFCAEVILGTHVYPCTK